jgi:solute:Na+ symporter, SSS family
MNNILLISVIVYLAISVAIGIIASFKIRNARDYVVASRRLPLFITMATVFATWFGSETVLGTSSTFITDGISGIITDPFGASLCLILVGLFFAKPLYRMNLITIGDFFRKKYGKTVEVLASICIVVSYLGWVSAQILALGIVFSVITQGAVNVELGMVIGAAVVLTYTFFGGMWSVALTDFFQMGIIIIGMLIVTYTVAQLVPGGAMAVIDHAQANGKFDFFASFRNES